MFGSEIRINRLLALPAIALAMGLSTHAGAGLLLADNFDEVNNDASTFNNNLASTQSGSLATVAYSVSGPGAWTAQHGNGNSLLVATAVGAGSGGASLNYNFAAQANAENKALQISFNIVSVSDYGDTSRWVQFNVGNAQHLDVANGGVGAGVYFRVNGQTDALSGGAGLGSTTWSANDLVTVTLTDTAGTGSAFNGNGSKVSISIGANDLGTFAIAQQFDAYVTFSAFNYGADQFGIGVFDNLSVSTVEIPEPGSLALMAVGGLLIARRRRD